MKNIMTEVVVVGAGQAGIATSEHLKEKGINHVVLERDCIAARWRKERWDSLVANGPVWHDRFPNLAFGGEQDRFASKEEIADYMVEYAEKFDLPIVEGVEVLQVTRKNRQSGFVVSTSHGTYECGYVVAATGAFQIPIIPPIVPEKSHIAQIHSSDYRNPNSIPEGGVLVVGAGSSGVQIAEELRASGREVYLSVGPHDRPPRSYRNRDFVYWLGVLGKWDMVAPQEETQHVTIAVTGAKGGYTIDFRDLASAGITLVGRTVSFKNGIIYFAGDLAQNIRSGDENYLSLLREADAYIAEHGLQLPIEPEAYELGEDPDCVKNPVLELNLIESGISTIIWSTGFGRDYTWLDVDKATDEEGKPNQTRGISEAHGIYFVGLPWQSRRGSSFIWGSWHDAKFVVDQIDIQRNYRDYANPKD
ncbi:NAD(P)/FAD-dependent oxidoreductase [Corynebacterium sp. sy039]|uniref:flavin-containing monooxygenase n=1 Tax=Corynebacterium sp. sy039 TaxID=2599641 RepID=UPI0011B53C4F|nr:NAD(P)/FAD-dependent oxidoreductase [Corynebacterium sp. sy039]QDZ43523.1 FAD-dependent oxidoreductase [Corynebacterium sp. sy039]